MSKDAKIDRDFNAVKAAFIGKYGRDNQRLVKDLNNLIEMREVQCFGRVRDTIVRAQYLTNAQIVLIQEMFKQWMK